MAIYRTMHKSATGDYAKVGDAERDAYLADGFVDFSPPWVELQATMMTVVVQGLAVGRDYRLVWTWTVSAIKQPSKVTIVRCVG